MHSNNLELISTGRSEGSEIVTNKRLLEQNWFKYLITIGDQGKINIQRGQQEHETEAGIVSRLGIETRHYVKEGEDHITLFQKAYDKAIAFAREREVTDIEDNIIAVLLGSTTSEERVPDLLPSACEYVRLKRPEKQFYVHEACATFNSGMYWLNQLAEKATGLEGYAIVSASEVLTKEWTDDNFDKIIFSDGSVVAIVKVTPGQIEPQKRGIIGCVRQYIPDGRLIVRGEDGNLYMDGRKVLPIAARAMVEDFETSAKKAGLKLEDLTRIIFHQGSKHIFNRVGVILKKALGREDMGDGELKALLPSILETSANLGGATVGSTLDNEIRSGRVNKDDKIYLGSIGWGWHRSGFIVNGFPLLESELSF